MTKFFVSLTPCTLPASEGRVHRGINLPATPERPGVLATVTDSEGHVQYTTSHESEEQVLKVVRRFYKGVEVVR